MSEKNKKITLEHIREAAEYIFNQKPKTKPKERVIKFVRGCDTYGYINSVNTCKDKNCYSCSQFRSMFKEEFEKEIQKNQE